MATNETKTTEATRDYTVVGQVHSGGRLRTAGESVKLTEKQAQRALKSGAIAETSSPEAGKARDQSKERARHENDRDRLAQVPFTGNTAGQPIAEAPIPFQNTAETTIMPSGEDKPEKGVSENRMAPSTGGTVQSKTTGQRKASR